MPTPAQKSWRLEQAIEIVKHAPADSQALHDRLKRTYKRLLALVADADGTSGATAAKPSVRAAAGTG
jgi:hypothetical protein